MNKKVPTTKHQIKKSVKKHRKNAEKAGDQVGEHFDRHIASRWDNLSTVRRFVGTWSILVILLAVGVVIQKQNLSTYYQTEVSSSGGVLIEGVVGEINNLNPIFASSAVDSSVSRLLFNGLLRYDDNNELVGDLASEWSVDKKGLVYTLKLREDAVWHDGRSVSADDVVFTVETIQHPDTRSSLNASWQSVKVQKIDDKTVTFSLTNPFTPFVHSLTLQPLPAHVLADVPPLELRAHPYNLQPLVGTGPFKFDQLILDGEIGQIEMNANKQYKLGAPRLDKVIIRAFEDHETMIVAFEEGEITSMAGLRSFDYDHFSEDSDTNIYDMPLYNGVFTFFNHSDDLLKNKNIRKALTAGTNRKEIFNLLDNRFAIGQGPLLASQLGYDARFVQTRYNLDTANKILEKEKWTLRDDGYRYNKKGDILKVTLVTQSTGEFPELVEELQRQWKDIGVKLDAILVSPDILQQSHIVPHNYQILLANVSLGIDPDVYVYWHSSQAVVRGFNFSEFKNDNADLALEAGRTRVDKKLRKVKYKAFLKEWTAANPAVSLYQPAFSYAQQEEVKGFKPRRVVNPTDRFLNVEEWTVNTVTVSR